MLHRADATYVTGRSDVLLKLKPWHDAEATVIGHQPGRGKYAGMLGALRVRTADGVEFMLGSGLSDAERRQPPAIGSFDHLPLSRSDRARAAAFRQLPSPARSVAEVGEENGLVLVVQIGEFGFDLGAQGDYRRAFSGGMLAKHGRGADCSGNRLRVRCRRTSSA
jgi:ATP-dependent DNA ligase